MKSPEKANNDPYSVPQPIELVEESEDFFASQSNNTEIQELDSIHDVTIDKTETYSSRRKILKKVIKKVLREEQNLPTAENEQDNSYDPTSFWMYNLVENSSNLMCVVRNGYIAFINSSGINMLKFMALEELVGLPFYEIIDSKDKILVTEKIDELINKASPISTYLICADGRKLEIDLSIISIEDPEAFSFLAEAKDVSYVKKLEAKSSIAEEKFKKISMHDSLTGLPSDNLFEDRLQMAISRSTREAYGKPESSQNRIGVMLMNIDQMTPINASLGYDAGDHILRNIAVRLASSLRQCDTIARDKGDGFIMVLEGLNTLDDAETVARRTLGIMYEDISYKGNSLALGCSIGISIFPNHGIKARTLYVAAKAALREVKKSGGGLYRIYDESIPLTET